MSHKLENNHESIITISIGEQLPYCRTPDLQCCTTDYLDDLKYEKSLDIASSAQTDLMNIFNPWHQSLALLTGMSLSFH